VALICVECEEKMTCTYSVGVTEALTFRAYKCKQCGWYRETVELPLGLFDELKSFDYVELLKKLRGAKALKMRRVRINRKRAPTVG
jgi:hypothetical protein